MLAVLRIARQEPGEHPPQRRERYVDPFAAIISREEDTAENFLEAYLGYRDAVLDLQRMTYFDFELGVPVLERYGVLVVSPAGT